MRVFDDTRELGYAARKLLRIFIMAKA